MKKIILITTVLVLLLSTLSCSSKYPDPLEIASALSEIEISLPDGCLYHSSASEGSDGYLSNEMLTAVYGIPSDYNGIISAAVRLSSFNHPCELAVFLCTTTDDTENVALFCRTRLDILAKNASKAAEFSNLSFEEYLKYVENAAVVISGRYVALIISSDPQAARRELLSMV